MAQTDIDLSIFPLHCYSKLSNTQERNVMRSLIYWLMGDETGRRVVGGWKWWWHTSIFSFSRPRAAIAQMSAAIAEESLRSMQENVRVLEKAVERQTSVYTKIKAKYAQKATELMKHQTGDRTIEALQVEQFLEQLNQQVERAGRFLSAVREKLQHEQRVLERHKVDMQMINDLVEIDQAVAEMAKTNRQIRADTADAQFTAAKGAFHKQLGQLQAEAEITSEKELNSL